MKFRSDYEFNSYNAVIKKKKKNQTNIKRSTEFTGKAAIHN